MMRESGKEREISKRDYIELHFSLDTRIVKNCASLGQIITLAGSWNLRLVFSRVQFKDVANQVE